MMKHAIASRYAKALFTVDASKGIFQDRLEDFDYILKLFEIHPKLVKILNAPQITQKEKEDLLKGSLKKTESSDFFNFLFYLIKKKRLNILSAIQSAYMVMVDEYEGIWEAEFKSGLVIDAGLKKKLKDKIQDFYNKKVIFKEILDPSVVGGALFILPNKMINWSVKVRLKKLEDKLLSIEI
jgi:F-type H+-transporting ATPase subunit delta